MRGSGGFVQQGANQSGGFQQHQNGLSETGRNNSSYVYRNNGTFGSSSSYRNGNTSSGYASRRDTNSQSGFTGRSTSSGRPNQDTSLRVTSGSHGYVNNFYQNPNGGQVQGRSGNRGGYSSRGSSSQFNGLRFGTSFDRLENHVRTGSSHSGIVQYRANNNRTSVNQTRLVGPRVSRAPRGLISFKWIGGRVERQNWRTGYWAYWTGWTDSFFCYPFYSFDPYDGPCYSSPWYYYPCLPAYLDASRVIIADSLPSENWTGQDYNWQPQEAEARSSNVLDYSIDDMVNAFQEDDHKAIDRLIPQDGNVNIYVDSQYSYSLAANDFYDTYIDGIESTKTDHYEILDVKVNDDGTARVTAKHIYDDPWGKRAFVYHSYFLVKEGNQFVIREFGTSNYLGN